LDSSGSVLGSVAGSREHGSDDERSKHLFRRQSSSFGNETSGYIRLKICGRSRNFLCAKTHGGPMKIAVFWVVAPFSLVEVYQRFRCACCLRHHGDE
jgi:hypothetical protein